MSQDRKSRQAAIPSVDRLLNAKGAVALIETHGRTAVTNGVRMVLDELRRVIAEGGIPDPAANGETQLLGRTAAVLDALAQPNLTPVFNLTGTILHTNLGRAPLPQVAIAAMARAAGAVNLEFDLGTGKRGDRDSHLEALLCELTGAQAATVVNNNAAAVLLTLNTLGNRREVPVSRGELIEIGGAFRVPDIMRRAGCRLVEVGTTNRTHLHDFEEAIGSRTALLMKVHTSNYVVEGFTADVAETALAALAHANDLAFMVDLGSGTLADFAALGLPAEPTPAQSLAAGADLVTFSGDKLLGGPQAGIIVGRADLVAKIKRNPMKRALRLDKVTIAALEAVLRLYRDPDRLVEALPSLRLLTRPIADIAALGARLAPQLAARFEGRADVAIVDCRSQIGSGALPVESLAGKALEIRPLTKTGGKKPGGAALNRISAAFRALPVPVVGRIHDGAFLLDLRCLENEDLFVEQLAGL